MDKPRALEVLKVDTEKFESLLEADKKEEVKNNLYIPSLLCATFLTISHVDFVNGWQQKFRADCDVRQKGSTHFSTMTSFLSKKKGPTDNGPRLKRWKTFKKGVTDKLRDKL